ncbi:hypothetical protein [Gaoshiqia sediminis]|uniref:PABS domain-containing protein n=1 Tax=Gaoshiqia sediminis TaxID=2986998 RepID=A0AA42CA69_9BACT|nr:hypothetical protein [Gaoshiqia sediminis]MCW0483362.1 hypothetical protein [Gaoshiqia sediminis]
MNSAYPLIPVVVITILAYFTTRMYVWWGIFSQKTHRMFWNVALLVTFLVSGLLGLLSVLKVNYKLEIPQYDQFLRWHVAFGIGMVVISFFHLSWHWSYYFSLKKRAEGAIPGQPVVPNVQPEWEKVRYLLFLLGALAMINQVVFIREFLSVLAGNELVLGVVMANWLLLTGWGAFHARKRIQPDFSLKQGVSMMIALAFLPILLIVALYELKFLLYPPGTITGFGAVVMGVCLLLFPVCFLSGYLFTLLSTLYSWSGRKNLIGKAYAIESLGSLAGGLLFGVVLGRFFNSIQVLAIISAAVLTMGSWLIWPRNLKKRMVYLLPGLLILVVAFVLRPDTRIKQILFPSQEIILDRSTPYGNLVVSSQAGQLNFYEDHALHFYSDNLALSEEAVHFAMLQHPKPEKVLLLSGGISGMLKELDKYPLEKVTYIETNPAVLRYWKNLVDYASPSEPVEFVRSDIRVFLRKTKLVYDVVLINLPPPTTLGFNRFYTDEFFRMVAQHVTPGGVVCTSLPSTVNYAGENALLLNASLWKTLGLHFENRLLLPGEKNYFLASAGPLSPAITELVDQKGIGNEYVNAYYLDDGLLAQRGQLLMGQFHQVGKVNRDFYPYMFLKQTDHWLSRFQVSYNLLVLVPLILFFVLFARLNPVSMGLYTGGFSSASLEITLMLAYQVFFGSIYLATAFFFTFFMGGLALGSSMGRKPGKMSAIRVFAVVQFLLAVFSVLLPLLILLIDRISGWGVPAQLLFFVLVFVLAFGIGYEFFLASGLQSPHYSVTSGLNYSTDLAGSAFGAFLTALVMLPFLGLVYTCLIVAGLNIFSGVMALSVRNHRIF